MSATHRGSDELDRLKLVMDIQSRRQPYLQALLEILKRLAALEQEIAEIKEKLSPRTKEDR